MPNYSLSDRIAHCDRCGDDVFADHWCSASWCMYCEVWICERCQAAHSRAMPIYHKWGDTGRVSEIPCNRLDTGEDVTEDEK